MDKRLSHEGESTGKRNSVTTDEISLENVLRRCGDFGRYQLIHYICLNLICIATGANAFFYVFGVAEPSFRCRIPSNIWPGDDQFEFINDTHRRVVDTWISSTSKCHGINGSKCTNFVYDRSVFGRTFTEHSNFVCDNAVKRTWLATATKIGACSVLISGPISDKIGRKKVIQTLIASSFIFSVVTQSVLQFIRMTVNIQFIILFINQLLLGVGAYSLVFLLLMELTSSSHTSFAGNLALVTYTFGEIIVAAFAYIARDWLNLKWLNSAYYVLILPYLYFVPESPYWLFAQNKYSQLEACLRKIATTNGRNDHEWFLLYKQLLRKPSVVIRSTNQAKKRKIGRFLPRIGFSGFIAFVTMLLYIKISYGLGAMNKTFSPHWNIVIGAVVEGIGYTSASFLVTTRLGRKYAIMIYALLTSICVLVIPFIEETHPIMTIVISQIGKLVISGAVSVSWIYVSELLPTWMRGLGNAVFVIFGRFGAILAPIVDAAVSDKYIKVTSYVYSGLTLVMIGIIIFLPETRNRSFNDGETDDDKSQIDNLSKGNPETSGINAEFSDK